MQVWLSDDNAIVREKFRKSLVVRVMPLFVAIVRQGKTEGTFSASSPEDTARVLVSLIQAANELATELFVAHQATAIPLEVVERTLAAYTEAYERILGASPGSLNIGNGATLREWFI
jgi:hypothetical protein